MGKVAEHFLSHMYEAQGYDFFDTVDDVPPEREAWEARIAIEGFLMKAPSINGYDAAVLMDAMRILKQYSGE